MFWEVHKEEKTELLEGAGDIGGYEGSVHGKVKVAGRLAEAQGQNYALPDTAQLSLVRRTRLEAVA